MHITKAAIVAFAMLVPATLAHAGDKLTNRRATTRTPVTRTQLLSVLRDSHQSVFGFLPTTQRLAMAWAQVALENGQGKYVYDNNVGNVAPYRADQPFYIVNKNTKYRAFDTLEEGAGEYWHVVGGCKGALAAFDAGQPSTASQRLQKCGYFEADIEPYTNGMKSLYNEAVNHVVQEEKREQEELMADDADDTCD